MATKLSYSQKLRDPRWQRKRLEVMDRDEFTCQRCFDSHSTLNVHHKHYHKGRDPWDYALHELVTLCESCHDLQHEENEDRKVLFSKLRIAGPRNVAEALGLIAGWASGSTDGQDVSEFLQKQPHEFVQGEIASLVDDAANQSLEVLMRMHSFMVKLGPEGIRQLLDPQAKEAGNGTHSHD